MANILKRIDWWRDGSFGATYECDDEFCRRTLFFKFNYDCIDWKHGAYFRQFIYVELQEHHSFQWTNKINTLTLDDYFDCKLRVSWATARRILGELAEQSVGLSERDQEFFEEMICIANSEGTGNWVPATNRASADDHS